MISKWFSDVSPCISGPCQNNGTCVRKGLTQNYTCTCVHGFMGQLCEIGIHVSHPLKI